MSLEIDLVDKTAFVSGGSRGVGRAIAVTLAKAGARVGFSYHTRQSQAERTLELIRDVGCVGWANRLDVSIEADVKSAFERVDKEWPRGLDIFIANAGIWPSAGASITELTLEQWKHTIAVDLDGVFLTCRQAAHRMRGNGRIVVVGSAAGTHGEPFHADYSAAKGALVAFTKAVAVELAPKQVTVNCVAPGWIDTEMVASALAGMDRKNIEERIPLKRIATCDDVAGPVAFLCSPLARHVTGQVLHINGGGVL